MRDRAGLTDGQLLENFISRRDESALAALVWRHGPMVWSVCRRVLRHHHDAEDAFQATFLVFVRKAGSIASRELLANWLYGVAFKTSMKARVTDAKRKGRERQVAEMPEPAATEPELWPEWQSILDQELSRLPDKYRAVIVLCDLDGKTRKEAARQLGLPEGTIASRMATARSLLAKQLARVGLAVSGEAVAELLAQNVASAGVPMSVASSTIQSASVFAAGQAAAAGVISPKVAALAQGVLKAMLLTKFKMGAVAIALFVLAGGAVILTSRAQESKNDAAASKQTNKDDKPKDARLAQEPARATSEERYRGKPIAYWLERFQEAPNNPFNIDAVKSFSADVLIPALLGMLDDNSPDFRINAAEIFRKIGAPLAKTAVPALVKLLKEGRPRYPYAVVFALCQIGPSAKEALPAIGRAMRDAPAHYEDQGQGCVSCLGDLGEAAIPLIVELLEEKDAYFKRECARALGTIGPAAKRTTPKLEALLKHESPEVQVQAAIALWRIEKHAGAIPALAAMLMQPGPAAAFAAYGLWEIGPDAKEALPALKEALKDERADVQQAALATLQKIDPSFEDKSKTGGFGAPPR